MQRRIRFWAPAVLAAFTMFSGACSTTEGSDDGDDEEICTDGVDNDGDGASDCDDPDCAGLSACSDAEVCDNSVDDDGDGATDCDDADCAADAACASSAEICDNAMDDDGDGDADCADSDCALDAACVIPVEDCDNTADDDGDGDVDCDDADCRFDPACSVTVEDCGNGSDDDGDGDIDCADADCATDVACGGVCAADASYGAATLTDQAADADLPDFLAVAGALNADIDALQIELYDGFGAMAGGIVPGTFTIAGDDLNYGTCGLCVRLFTEDTADAGYFATGGTVTITSVTPDVVIDVSGVSFQHVEIDGTTFESTPHADGCASGVVSASFSVSATPEICDNDMDDDGDEIVDCDDPDCAADPACTSVREICDNDMDDDGDEIVDCDDPDCAADPACTSVREICDNDMDDDGDELVDCDDPDCAADLACAVCTADADYGAATLVNQGVFFNQPAGGAIGVQGDLNADPDTLLLELYDGLGAFAGGVAEPGTYTLSGADLNYATCGLCVRLVTEDLADDGYMATGGTVTITSVSPNVTATLSGLTFEHVTIDGTTFESTPVGDGCTSAVTSASFDVSTAEVCDSGVDDDGDGNTDCDDSDCIGDPSCPAVVCEADADYGAATLTNQVGGDSLPDELFVQGDLNGDVDLLAVEMYDGFGVFAGGITTGTFTLAGDELNYATCGLCVRLGTEGGDSGYLATGGTVTITEITPDVVMSLSGLTFEHVEIDADTFVSTPHPDACLSAVTSASFDVTPTL